MDGWQKRGGPIPQHACLVCNRPQPYVLVESPSQAGVIQQRISTQARIPACCQQGPVRLGILQYLYPIELRRAAKNGGRHDACGVGVVRVRKGTVALTSTGTASEEWPPRVQLWRRECLCEGPSSGKLFFVDALGRRIEIDDLQAAIISNSHVVPLQVVMDCGRNTFLHCSQPQEDLLQQLQCHHVVLCCRQCAHGWPPCVLQRHERRLVVFFLC
mmetsp:Transcript_85458/g.215357  ORF Transcript_85458/g.215357 Transcript_85458/m.215357 type:complete len:215 (-) Transcript_85458:3-647(-)